MLFPRFLAFASLLALAGCGSGGNLGKSVDYSSVLAAPPVRQPLYDPYAPPGSAPVTWMPPVFNREGTIVRPADPSVDWRREDYERAPWYPGAIGSRAPDGTY